MPFWRGERSPEDQLAHENDLILMLGQALLGSISPNMRAISLEVIAGGARLHFLLAEDDPWDRSEIENEVPCEFGCLSERSITVESSIRISRDEIRTSLPGRLVYMRREFFLGPDVREHVQELLADRPFLPFRIVTADGRTHDLRRPELAQLTMDGILIQTGIDPDGPSHQFESYPLDQIMAVEPLGPAPT